MGYRILSIEPNSPLSEATPTEPLLDYIALPDGNAFLRTVSNFASFLDKSSGKEIELTLYNMANRCRRKVKVAPKKFSNGPCLLGINVCLEEFNENYPVALRVLNIYVGSPLDKAGLSPFTDYILGTRRQSFKSVQDFEGYVKCCNKSPVELLVYSSKTERVRAVMLMPDNGWGEAGYLGGDIGFGAAHLVPIRNVITKVQEEAGTVAVKGPEKVLLSAVPQGSYAEAKKEGLGSAQAADAPKISTTTTI